MNSELQKRLAALAPSICIRTLWEPDPDSDFDELTAPGCCFENEAPEDWEAWQSEVRATAILEGEEVTGSAYLGGTWEKSGGVPAESNPEISGYENQMTQDALCSLAAGLPESAVAVHAEITAALAECRRIAVADYEKQRAEIEAKRAAVS